MGFPFEECQTVHQNRESLREFALKPYIAIAEKTKPGAMKLFDAKMKK